MGMGNYGFQFRNITLAQNILADNRSHFMKELGIFLGKVRTIRETVIRGGKTVLVSSTSGA